jgi:hypothetical protein
MSPRTRLQVAAVTLAVFTTLAGSTAVAYFSATGAGTAAAGVTSLSKSTITAATPAVGGTVALTWEAVSAPSTGSVSYYVTRDGGLPAGSCPTSAAPAAVLTCVDKGLDPGTHTYVVTATWRSWSSKSSPATPKVTIGAATHFALSAASTTPVAGATDNLTIIAQDSANSTVTTYSGSHELTFGGAEASPGGTLPTVANSSGTAVNFGTPTAITFTTGVATVSSAKNGVMVLYRAGAATISVSEGTLGSAPGLAVTVSAATLSKLGLATTTTTPVAGAEDDLTITAQDTYSNTVTTYTGSHSLTFSGASASPGGNLPTVTNSSGTAVAFGTATPIAFTAGVASGSKGLNGDMRLYKSGAANIQVTEGALTSAPVTVTASPGPATKLVLGGSTLTPVAGATVSLTATAQDAYGNTATAYTGSHNLTFSGAAASLSGALPTVVDSAGTVVNFGTATAIAFTAGVATVGSSKNGVMTLYKAEPTVVVVSDGSISNGAGLSFTVSPTTAAKLIFNNVTSSAGTIAPGCAFTCTVTNLGKSGTVRAKLAVTDTYGNRVSGLGTGHTVSVTTSVGTVTEGSLAFPSTGVAESATQFTFTAPSTGSYSASIKAATSAGTVYTNATMTATK